MKFMVMTCAAFLARHKPVSTKAKPACMNMTKKPVTKVHITLIETLLWATFWINSSFVGFAYRGVGALVIARFSKVLAGTGHVISCSLPALAPPEAMESGCCGAGAGAAAAAAFVAVEVAVV